MSDTIRIPIDYGPDCETGHRINITPDIARQIVALSGEINAAYDLYAIHCDGHDEDMQRTKELEKRIAALERHYHCLGMGVTALPVTDEGPVAGGDAERWTTHTPCCNGGLNEACDCPVSMTHKELAEALLSVTQQRVEQARIAADLRAKLATQA